MGNSVTPTRPLLAALVPLAAALAQTAPVGGAWTPGFQHADGITVTTAATDPRTAFPGVTFVSRAFPLRLNAIHLALIPKGPYQGMVLAWDDVAVVGTPPPGATSQSSLYSYQAFAVVDPSPTLPPGAPRFRNFLLPIEPLRSSGGSFLGGDMFCSGHAWSPYGDLVVAGGTSFVTTSFGLLQLAAKRTWVFDPSQASPLYPGESGRWFAGPDLQHERYYPTTLLSGPLARLGGHQAMLVLGGDSVVGGPPVLNATWNSYEALEVTGPPGPAGSGLRVDTFTNAAGESTTWSGPSTMALPREDALLFYPRCHLRTDGLVFCSGFAPRSATLDPASTSWVGAPGNNLVAGNWNSLREYGASVHYPDRDGFRDLIVRIGGRDIARGTGITTNFVEAIRAEDPTADWRQVYPLNVPRSHLNVVILPDASLLAIGGIDDQGTAAPTRLYQPELFRHGEDRWQLLAPAFSARTYHSTAVLLPDGRVFVAGGDDRQNDRTGGQGGFDYEIFSPPYLAPAVGPPPPRPVLVDINGGRGLHPVDRVNTLARGAANVVRIQPLPPGRRIKEGVLLAPGSTTHHSDMSQRYHRLGTLQTTPTTVQFVPQKSATALPSGIYMLFLVSDAGIPSQALWVRLR